MKQTTIRDIRRKMRTDRMRLIFNRAIELGWDGRVTGGSHVRLLPPPGTGDEVLVISMTAPNKGRACQNNEAVLKRWQKRQKENKA